MDTNHIDYLIEQLQALKTAEAIVYKAAVMKKTEYTRSARYYHNLTPEKREIARKKAREYSQNLPEERKKELADKRKERYQTDEVFRNRIMGSTRKRNEALKQQRRLEKLEREAANDK